MKTTLKPTSRGEAQIAVLSYGQSANERTLFVGHVAALAGMQAEFSVVDDRGGTNAMLVLVRVPFKFPFDVSGRFTIEPSGNGYGVVE